MEVAPHTPPSPPQVNAKKGISIRSYAGLFSSALLRTLGVGLGIVFLFVAVGVITEVGQGNLCNVSVRTLYGDLMTYGDPFMVTDSSALVRAIERDAKDENIIAVVLDVDSGGGLPVAGEEIAIALERLEKPNVAVIRSLGASAAYWAAAGSDHIIASRSSDVGSIGVMVTFVDESEKNKQDGVAYSEFSSGEFKTMGTPNRPVTEKEEALVKRDIDEIHEQFMQYIASARKLTTEEVRTMSDGSTMTGARAKDAGLVDELGSFAEAREYIRGVTGKEPVLCEPNAEPLF